MPTCQGIQTAQPCCCCCASKAPRAVCPTTKQVLQASSIANAWCSANSCGGRFAAGSKQREKLTLLLLVLLLGSCGGLLLHSCGRLRRLLLLLRSSRSLLQCILALRRCKCSQLATEAA